MRAYFKLTMAICKSICLQVLAKTLDMTKLTSDKLEIATLRRIDNKTRITILRATEVSIGAYDIRQE